jgi:phage terminase small subunit
VTDVKSALTDKQQRFVEEYLVDLNATQAAIRAGYSEDTASEIGYENLRKPHIAAAIEVAQKARSERTQIDADWVLRRLAVEAEADLADLYNENGSLKPVHEWPMIWRQGLVAGIETHQEYEQTDEGKRPDGVIQKIKLSDRVRRLELLGKHIGVNAFAERHEHTGKNGGPIEQRVERDEATLHALAGIFDRIANMGEARSIATGMQNGIGMAAVGRNGANGHRPSVDAGSHSGSSEGT